MEGGGDMWSPDMSALNFYAYAMDLFMQSGHISSQIPEYANHSSEEFVYRRTENERRNPSCFPF